MTVRPRHYARLLLDHASDGEVTRRLNELTALAPATRRLRQLAANPETANIVDAVLAEVEPLLATVIRDLMASRHVRWLPNILRAMESLAVTRGLAIPAHVSVAHRSLDTEHLQRDLTPLFGTVSALEETTDETQLGGIEVRVADRVFDTRLDHRLNRLRLSLRERTS